ncbi:hypothetical protein NC651_004540 [Populus alba x Populus x berolinensis]|nr:hypothetical protein NC651_004540 [Populus alba x Populus x berolinensis]
MTADVSIKKEATVRNPCCNVWKEKCRKLEEGRKSLRQAVKLLTEQADKLQAENVSLKKACEEERVKVEAEKGGKEKEAVLRVMLENEISALKSEISTLQQKGSAFSEDENGEVKLLQDQVFEGEKEISRLKELLEGEKITADSEKKNAEVEKKSAGDAWKHVKAEEEGKEREEALRFSLENEISALKSEMSTLQWKGSAVAEDQNQEVKLLQDQVSKGEKEISRLKELLEIAKTRVDSEKKNAEVEKKSASEAWKLVKAEKAKADEERKHASSEGLKVEEYRLQLEVLKKEAELAKSKLASETLKYEEANKKFKTEKLKVTKEKKRADSETARAEVKKKLAEANRKKLAEEKSHTENLSKQLEDVRQRIEELQKAEEYQLQLESFKKEAAESKSKLVSEILKLEDANKKLEAEKAKVMEERKSADSEMAKAKEQKKLAETTGMKVVEEKSHADNLSRQLEDARIKIEELEKGINRFMLTKNMGGAFDDQHEILNGEAATIRFRDLLKNLKNNSDQSKLVLEFLNSEKANKRLDIEKQKAITEKKRVDLEILKAEKLKKLAEMNRKVAAEEKCCADQLSQQLEEYKIKIERLQKQIQELLSSKKLVVSSSGLPDKVLNVEKTKLKLLEKQMKLEKMRLKHAKEGAKMEININRNGILQQELACLKLDFGQMLFRLDGLHKYFSSSNGGTEKMEKVGDLGNMQRSKLKRKLCAGEPFQTHHNNESELLKPSCLAMIISEPLMQTLNCKAPLVLPSGGNYTASISGIDSKLESLLGASNRKLLAINSSSASFSDGQLVGSQERGAFVPTSKNLVEENFNAQTTISSMSGAVTKVQHDKNLAVVAENSVRSPLSIDIIGRVNGHSKKRRILDAVESVELLCSEGKKLHLQMEEKLSALHGMLNKQTEKSHEDAIVEPIMQGGSYAKHERTRKRRKVSYEENVIIHRLSGIDQLEKTKKTGKEVLEDANACRYTSNPANHIMGASKACWEGLIDSFESSPGDMVSFEKVANGDYMKLLDLDNSADEECYRRAMEMPMSPTLPEIGSSGAEISANKPLLVESFPGRLPNGKESLVPSFSSDAIDVEISSNQLKDRSFGTSCADLLHENEGPADSFDILGNRSGTCNTMDSGKVSDGRTRDPGSDLDTEMLNIPSSRYEGLKFPIEGELGSIHDNIPKYCVMFSDINDTISMSRVFFATQTCLARCSLDIQADCMVQKILCALKMEGKILPKEKACTFFTLLLLNFSASNWGKFQSFSDPDFLLGLDSFARDINAVVSDVEARNLFAEVCCLDELLGLIEEFLLDGKLMGVSY